MAQDEIMSNTEPGTEKRGRGRPLKYPRGEEPHRSGGSHRPGREALRERGGKMITIRLEPREVEALALFKEFRRHTTDRDAIGEAISGIVCIGRRELLKILGDSIATQPSSKEATKSDDLRGSAPDATGALSSEAFVRKLRDEWR